MAQDGFWGGSAGALVDPKRTFRWLISFGDRSNDIKSWYAKSASKPSYQVGKTTHQFLNHSFHYPGRVEWQEISVTLVDPARGNDSSLALVDSLQKAGYYIPINENNASFTITKAEAVNAAGNQVFLDQLGSDQSDIIERWTLWNPWIKDVNFGSLDYSTEDMVEVELTLVYDYATITAGVPTRTLPESV